MALHQPGMLADEPTKCTVAAVVVNHHNHLGAENSVLYQFLGAEKLAQRCYPME